MLVSKTSGDWVLRVDREKSSLGSTNTAEALELGVTITTYSTYRIKSGQYHIHLLPWVHKQCLVQWVHTPALHCLYCPSWNLSVQLLFCPEREQDVSLWVTHLCLTWIWNAAFFRIFSLKKKQLVPWSLGAGRYTITPLSSCGHRQQWLISTQRS